MQALIDRILLEFRGRSNNAMLSLIGLVFTGPQADNTKGARMLGGGGGASILLCRLLIFYSFIHSFIYSFIHSGRAATFFGLHWWAAPSPPAPSPGQVYIGP